MWKPGQPNPAIWSGFDPVAVAAERVRKHRSARQQRDTFTGNPLRTDIVGVIGEAAFAQWAGLSPAAVHALGPTLNNFSINAMRIDVRASEAAGYLAVAEKVFQQQRGKIEAYVLVKVNEGGVGPFDGVPVGWATYGILESEGSVFRLGNSDRAKVSQNLPADRLIQMIDLADWLGLTQAEAG